jgi:hydroxymethylpyrimidine kinase/phosphomethylpyrimidine kinase/thiamine-phosphate diphosphorylase
MPPPIIWSIAGHDSSGGAGLSADQRAADALGVHLCPVLACITAQNSNGVQAIHALSPQQLEAQLSALADDMPPAVIKTGLLGDVALIDTVARWIDKLRQRRPELALIIDPVLAASAGGAAFSDDAVLEAYRRELIPRATLITPNRAEARRLLGLPGRHEAPEEDLPKLASRLRRMGAQGVVITGGDAPHRGWAMDWMDVPQAQGWLCAPRVATPHHHGSGCTFASASAAAMALGHGSADAIVLGKMLTHRALADSHAAGEGAGPVKAGRSSRLGALPWLGIGTALPWQLQIFSSPSVQPHLQPALQAALPSTFQPLFRPFEPPRDGLYGILPDSDTVAAAAEAGMHCLQLRHKAREGVEAHIEAAAAHCARHGATLFINDHWPQALALPEQHGLQLGVHLGQEDLLALHGAAIDRLLGARHRILLGLSSHSLWELARAAGCGASLIACGPVQATTTKDMPWRPQGEDNLRWWIRHSPAPVVAIGGLLTPDDLRRHAACGPSALCVVRALGDRPGDVAPRLPELREAVRCGRSMTPPLDENHGHATMASLPHPVL